MINKRYKDIFQQYIYRGESTPLTIGTLTVCALCFLILIISTFTQFNILHPWFQYIDGQGIVYALKKVSYSPLMPAAIFSIYILGKNYSIFTYVLYLLTGFFIWPIFAFGGGLEYIQNYLFGYILSFIVAIFITGSIIRINQTMQTRVIAATLGVLSIHIFGFLYCVFLAIFRIINFSLLIPIFREITIANIFYDVFFSILVMLFAPYIKNILWTCMKPKPDKPKKLKNANVRSKITSYNINQHRQNNY